MNKITASVKYIAPVAIILSFCPCFAEGKTSVAKPTKSLQERYLDAKASAEYAERIATEYIQGSVSIEDMVNAIYLNNDTVPKVDVARDASYMLTMEQKIEAIYRASLRRKATRLRLKANNMKRELDEAIRTKDHRKLNVPGRAPVVPWRANPGAQRK